MEPTGTDQGQPGQAHPPPAQPAAHAPNAQHLRLQRVALEISHHLELVGQRDGDGRHVTSNKDVREFFARSFSEYLLEGRICNVMRIAPQLADGVVTHLVELLHMEHYTAAIVLESLAERTIYHRAVNDNGGVEALIEQVRTRLTAGWRGTPSIKFVLHALQRWLHQTLTLDAPHVKRVFAPRATLDVFVGLLMHPRCSDWAKAVAAEGLAVGLHDHAELSDGEWRRCFAPLSHLALTGVKRHRRSAIRALVVLATSDSHRREMAEVGGPSLMLAVAEFHESRSQQRCDHCQIEFSDGRSYAICGGCRSVLYCSAACQKEHWRDAHRAVCKRRTADWSTRLHVLVGRSWPCAEEKVVKLLREGADLHASSRADGPTPVSLATEAAMTFRAGPGTAAYFVLKAAAPWSHQTHSLFPAPARQRAWELLVLGHQLSSGSPQFEQHSQALMDAWLHCILPFAIDRDSVPLAGSMSAKEGASSRSSEGGTAAWRPSEASSSSAEDAPPPSTCLDCS